MSILFEPRTIRLYYSWWRLKLCVSTHNIDLLFCFRSSSASHLTSDLSQSSDLSQTSQSTHVQTLPVQATSHGTYVVPVRVTVTREQTLPGGQEVYYEQTPSGSVVKHTTVKESFSSRTSSGAVQPSYVRTVEGSSLQGSSGGYVASQHAATGNTGKFSRARLRHGRSP